MTEAVIVVPGIMGSELWNDDELVWPGSPFELLLPYAKMAQLLDPALRVGDVVRRVSVSVQYQHLVDTLAACGFREEGDKPTLRLCAYDWRKDNAVSARTLATHVQALRQDHGAGVRIALLAHSMGGLVARYLLESGRFDEANCSGFANIRRLVTFGTPHRGAPLALSTALGQEGRLFLSAAQVKEIASHPDFPALYQLLPPPSEPFLWDTSADSRLAHRSPYDDEVAGRLGLSAANVASAREFHAALDVARRPPHIDYFCFVGTRHATLSHARADFASTTLDPRGVFADDSGDGTVPAWSAAFPGVQQLAVGGEHGTLYQDEEVCRTLAALLGKAGVLALSATALRLALSTQFARPGDAVRAVVLPRTPLSSLDAEIVVTKRAAADGRAIAEAVVARHRIRYTGAAIDSMTVVVPVPAYAGVYAFGLHAGTTLPTARPVELLVQDR
ncbi:lipase/acyltransferase domain-containing protein [Ramlibacter sp.]|uniref:lipase/acyltransferase domain-containing protein n=1 Tax=Ramlibacter sp. TaxID=1917967 RepID=UPI003D119848